MNAEHRDVGSHLLREWLVANFVAFTIGAAAWGGALRALELPYYGADVSTMEAARIQAMSNSASAFLFGAVVGISQALVLRHVIRAGWWIAATCVGWALSGVVTGFSAGGSVSTIGPDAGPVPPPLSVLVISPLVVLLLGAGQWLVLRRTFDRAGWWPLVNVGALIPAMGTGLVIAKTLPWFAPTDYPSAPALAVVGAIAGPLYGYLTWLYLAQLRRRGARLQEAPSILA
jgi:hypothetical protein